MNFKNKRPKTSRPSGRHPLVTKYRWKGMAKTNYRKLPKSKFRTKTVEF